jgi:hypothetical protein
MKITGIFLVVLLLSSIVVFLPINADAVKIPPTKAFSRATTSNSTVYAMNYSTPINFLGGKNVNITGNNLTKTIKISVNIANTTGESTTASNLLGTYQWFAQIIGFDLQFRGLDLGQGLTAVQNATTIKLSTNFKVDGYTCPGGSHAFSFDNFTGQTTCTSDSGGSGTTLDTISNIGKGGVGFYANNSSDTHFNFKNLTSIRPDLFTLSPNATDNNLSSNFKSDNISCGASHFVLSFNNSTGVYTCGSESGGTITGGSNIGTNGVGFFKNSSSNTINLRNLTTTRTDLFSLTQSLNDVNLGSSFKSSTLTCSAGNAVTAFNNATGVYTCSPFGTGSGTITTAANVGKGGKGFFKDVTGSTINLRNVTSTRADLITVSQNVTDVNLGSSFKSNTKTCSGGQAVTAFDNSTGIHTCTAFGSGNGNITGSGSANQVPYFTSSTNIAGATNLIWDNTNKILKGLTDTQTSLGTSTVRLNNYFGSVVNSTTAQHNTLTTSTGSTITIGTAATLVKPNSDTNTAFGTSITRLGNIFSGGTINATTVRGNTIDTSTGSTMQIGTSTTAINPTSDLLFSMGTTVKRINNIFASTVNSTSTKTNTIVASTGLTVTITGLTLSNNADANTKKIINLAQPTLSTDAQASNYLGIIGNLTTTKCANNQVLGYNASSSSEKWKCFTFNNGTLSAAITSINSDTTAAQTIAGTTNQVTVTDAGATHTLDVGSNVIVKAGAQTITGVKAFSTRQIWSAILDPAPANGNIWRSSTNVDTIKYTSGLANYTIFSTVTVPSNGTPANPTGTTSTVGRMMGLAQGFTPKISTDHFIEFCGQMSNSLINDGASVNLRFGSTATPTNGAAATGTQVGATQTFTALVAAQKDGFCVIGVAQNLTIGTVYWADIDLAATTAGTATITGLTYVQFEV